MNRLKSIIADIASEQRQAEHDRRVRRVKRSEEMYVAAMELANEHGITLTFECGVYRLCDNRHHIAFYPISCTVMRSIFGANRLERLDVNAELDVYDVVMLFASGAFLK